MQVQRREPDREQATAYANGDVRTIAEALCAHDADPRLVRWARQTMISLDEYTREQAEAQFAGEAHLVDAAMAIAKSGARIAAVRDEIERGRRQGAVLERLVFCLVSRRAAPIREVAIELLRHPHSGKAWSGRKDVGVDDTPLEIYECKYGGGFEQWEVDELGDIYLTSLAEERRCVPGIATMGSQRQATTRAARLTMHEPLFYTFDDELSVLAKRPISNRLH